MLAVEKNPCKTIATANRNNDKAKKTSLNIQKNGSKKPAIGKQKLVTHSSEKRFQQLIVFWLSTEFTKNIVLLPI